MYAKKTYAKLGEEVIDLDELTAKDLLEAASKRIALTLPPKPKKKRPAAGILELVRKYA